MSSSTCPALLTTEWEKPQRTSTSGDSITPDANVQKLGIQMIKAMIAETIEEVEDSDYVDGVTKVYVIHPPQLEDELRCHLSALPVPAISASRSERLISIAVGQEIHHFVVEPYKMDLTRRRSTDPRSLAGKPLAGFCATRSRRIQDLYGMVVHVIRCNTHYAIDNRR